MCSVTRTNDGPIWLIRRKIKLLPPFILLTLVNKHSPTTAVTLATLVVTHLAFFIILILLSMLFRLDKDYVKSYNVPIHLITYLFCFKMVDFGTFIINDFDY